MAGTVGVAPKRRCRRHRAADHGDARRGDHAGGRQRQGHSRLAETNTKFSGIGDMAAVLKVKAAKLPGPEIPDPGGMALMLTMRLPTGSRDNLRGLGVYRTLASAAFSGGKGPFKPHGSGGFEFWSKSVDVHRDRDRRAGQRPPPGAVRRRRRNRGPPESHLAARFPGTAHLGGGEVGVVSDPVPANATGSPRFSRSWCLPEGILKGHPGARHQGQPEGQAAAVAERDHHDEEQRSALQGHPVVGINLGL